MRNYDIYEKLVQPPAEGGGGLTVETALDKLGMVRDCCRRMYITHNPEIERRLLMYDTSAIRSREVVESSKDKLEVFMSALRIADPSTIS